MNEALPAARLRGSDEEKRDAQRCQCHAEPDDGHSRAFETAAMEVEPPEEAENRHQPHEVLRDVEQKVHHSVARRAEEAQSAEEIKRADEDGHDADEGQHEQPAGKVFHLRNLLMQSM